MAAAANTLRLRPTTAAIAEATPDQDYLPTPPARLLEPDPSRRTPVTFRNATGVKLAGHLYRPPSAAPDEKTPAIVMLGPVSSVKEQTLPHYAERFSAAGYTILAFDPRGFGESEGEPRWHYDPALVIDDYSAAANYLMARADIRPDRVCLVGVCMGGGFAISAAARNKRVAAVASIAGGYDIGSTFQRFMGVDGFARYLGAINDLVRGQLASGEVTYVPSIAQSLSTEVPIAWMPNAEAYSYYDRTSRSHAPTWSRRMTVAGLEPYFTYNAVVHAALVAPTPLLILHGTTDLQLWPEFAQAAYDAAIGPKELIWIETHNHIELYDQDPYVSEAAAQTLAWLSRVLK